jgi:hypothetical protein
MVSGGSGPAQSPLARLEPHPGASRILRRLMRGVNPRYDEHIVLGRADPCGAPSIKTPDHGSFVDYTLLPSRRLAFVEQRILY